MPMKRFCVIRKDIPATEEGKLPDRKDVGRVVWMDEENDVYWWIPVEEMVEKANPAFPNNPKRRVRHFLKAPRWGRISEAHQAETEGRMAFTGWTRPELFKMTDDDLRDNVHAATERSRRNLKNSMDQRNAKWELIKEIVKGRPEGDLFNRPIVQELIETQRIKHKLKDNVRIVRALREFMYWGFETNGLLPKFYRINVRNKPKLARKKADGTYAKPGRMNKDTDEGKVGVEGYVLREHDRAHLGRGWKKFKTSRAVSVEKAYDLTMEMYYRASTVDHGNGEIEVVLLPEHERPTVHQFQRHGPANDPAKSAERVNLGFRKHEMTKRGLRMKAIAGVVAAGTHGYIDSTSCDQNLVRTGDRNSIISSPNVTVVMERRTSYILGVHIGFEPPSTMTALMAIANAAQSKKDWCGRYGVPYVESEWVYLPLKRILHDNGELKSESGIRSLSRSEMTVQFARTYRGDDKGPVEAGHKSIARESSHQMPGTTLGEAFERGQENPAKNACLTYREYVPQVIKTVIWLNNYETVKSEVYTEEMMRDKVAPTRAGILKWMMSKGYVSTQQEDLGYLRTHCLPRFDAVIDLDGVHVVNPQDSREHIARLIYSSAALDASGLKEWARSKGVIPGKLLLNPSELGKAWFVNGEELIEVNLSEVDPELAEMTLVDVLKSNVALGSMQRETKRKNVNRHVSKTVSNYRVGEAAKAAKKAQQKAEGAAPPLKAQQANKRESTRAEAHDERLRILGLPTPVPQPPEAATPIEASAVSETNSLPRSNRNSTSNQSTTPHAAINRRQQLMEQVRAARNAKQ